MTKTTKSATKPSTEEAVITALKAKPEATAAEVASAAGIGRSTANKTLAQLADSRRVRRTEGGRDGARRLPDRFALASTDPKTAKTSTPKAGAKEESSKNSKTKAPDDRLKPGQLDGLVLTYLKKNASSGPHGPTAVARALDRSSGAVGNCLVRLTKTKQVRQDSEKPRRYSLAA